MLGSDFYDNIVGIIISAFILFAALAWRDCAIVYVNRHPHIKNNGAWTYAFVVTFIALLAIVFLMYPLKYAATGKY